MLAHCVRVLQPLSWEAAMHDVLMIGAIMLIALIGTALFALVYVGTSEGTSQGRRSHSSGMDSALSHDSSVARLWRNESAAINLGEHDRGNNGPTGYQRFDEYLALHSRSKK